MLGNAYLLERKRGDSVGHLGAAQGVRGADGAISSEKRAWDASQWDFLGTLDYHYTVL